MKTTIWLNVEPVEERFALSAIGIPDNNNLGGRRWNYQPCLHFIMKKELNPKPYAAPGAADTCNTDATQAASHSCLDSSPRKWLRAPVAPNVLAGRLRHLFWGPPDASIVSEARARIERVVEQAMEQPQFLNANHTGSTR
jgi:hypothetical protein